MGRCRRPEEHLLQACPSGKPAVPQLLTKDCPRRESHWATGWYGCRAPLSHPEEPAYEIGKLCSFHRGQQPGGSSRKINVRLKDTWNTFLTLRAILSEMQWVESSCQHRCQPRLNNHLIGLWRSRVATRGGEGPSQPCRSRTS